MEKIVLDFLSSLEGYHQVLKEIHWSTHVKSEHLLTDDIDGDVLEYEDRIAEICMGVDGDRIGIGDLKTLLPNAKTLSGLLHEMSNDVVEFKKKIEKKNEFKSSAIINALDDLSEAIGKWLYLETFK